MPTKYVIFFAFACFLCGSTIKVCQAYEKHETEYSESEKKEIERLNAELEKEIDIDVIRLPLERLVADISKFTMVPTFLDDAELRKVDVSRKLPITVNSSGGSVKHFFTKQLKPLRLTFDVRPNGVHIIAVKDEK